MAQITQEKYKELIKTRIKSLEKESKRIYTDSLKWLNQGYIDAYELIIQDLNDYEIKSDNSKDD